MLIEKRHLRNFDFGLVVVVLAISIIGLLVIASATRNNEPGDPLYFVTQQMIGIALGLGVMILFSLIDYRTFGRLSNILYLLNLSVLGLVIAIGVTGGGAQSWLKFGPVTIQPSEFAKIIIIITLAHYIARNRGIGGLTQFGLTILHVLVPMALIIKQPDLGTAMIFVGILLGILFMAGTPMAYLGYLFACGAAASPLVWMYLQPHQKDRLMVFLNPENVDPLGAGYHLRQSIITIGSGKLLGNGLFSTQTQTQINFLPAQHTDFVFSVLAESWGFIGAAAVLLLYGLLLYRIIQIAAISGDMFGKLIATGFASLIAFQVFVNVGMTIGIMPVTGIPLPFLSYGRSAYIALMAGIGLLESICIRRHKITF